MVAAICAAVFLLMNGAGFLSDEIATKRPERLTSAEYLTATGYFLKEEKTVIATAGYTVSNEVKDGERVRTDTVVAKLYENGADLTLVSKLDKLSSRIESLERINSGDLSYKQDALLLEAEIDALIVEMTEMTQNGSFEGLSDSTDLLIHYFNIRQILLNEAENFDLKIASLKEELNEIKSICPTPKKSVKAGEVGYFTYAFDGYEGAFGYERITDLSVADELLVLRETKPENRPDGYIGKTVTDFVWRVAVPMTSAEASAYRAGNTVKLVFPKVNGEQYTATVLYSQSFRGEALVIFEGNFGPEVFAKERITEVNILRSSASVLSVPASALLQNEEDVTGVYVLIGQQVVFKPVNFVKYEGDFAYVTPITGSSNALSEYDEVIYSGKNLFDGKII